MDVILKFEIKNLSDHIKIYFKLKLMFYNPKFK